MIDVVSLAFKGTASNMCIRSIFLKTLFKGVRTATADPQALHRVKCCRSFELLSSAGFKRTLKSRARTKQELARVTHRDRKTPRHTSRRESGTEAEMKGN